MIRRFSARVHRSTVELQYKKIYELCLSALLLILYVHTCCGRALSELLVTTCLVVSPRFGIQALFRVVRGLRARSALPGVCSSGYLSRVYDAEVLLFVGSHGCFAAYAREPVYGVAKHTAHSVVGKFRNFVLGIQYGD